MAPSAGKVAIPDVDFPAGECTECGAAVMAEAGSVELEYELQAAPGPTLKLKAKAVSLKLLPSCDHVESVEITLPAEAE